MSRPVIYMCHPLGADTDAGISANLARALRWLAWLRKSFPATTFIAPWIATVYSLGGDDSPELREAGLVDDCAVVEICEGVVLVGGRISSGMEREKQHAGLVSDLTHLGDEPPDTWTGFVLWPEQPNALDAWQQWFDANGRTEP